MKTTIKITGFLSLFFIAIGILFKLLHWPGAALLLLFGNLSFTLIFLPLFFIRRVIKSNTTIEKVTNIIGLIALLLFFSGSIFKVQHWPGASLALLTGTFLFALIALPLYIFGVKRDSEKKFSELTSVVFIGVYISIFLFLYSLNYGRSILTTYATLGEQQMISTNTIVEIIGDYDTQLQNGNLSPEFETISKMSNELSQIIKDTKGMLISQADGMHNVEEKIEHNREVMNKDNFDVTNQVMLGNRGNQIKTMIVDYRNAIVEYLNNKEAIELAEQIESLLYTGDYKQYDRLMTWEEEMFYYVPISGALAVLSGIEHDIKVAELKFKRYMTNEE